jgi:hypothetical protein
MTDITANITDYRLFGSTVGVIEREQRGSSFGKTCGEATHFCISAFTTCMAGHGAPVYFVWNISTHGKEFKRVRSVGSERHFSPSEYMSCTYTTFSGSTLYSHTRQYIPNTFSFYPFDPIRSVFSTPDPTHPPMHQSPPSKTP